MQQIFVNQEKATKVINIKVENMYNYLNGNFEALTAHVKKLGVKTPQTA